MIKVKRNDIEHELNVDVLEELNFYDWNRVRVKPEEMVACSPFRDEKSPSFSINLDTGLWRDFGSDDYFSKGNLTTLLSFLRNETHHEVDTYLITKYGFDFSNLSSLKLNIDFSTDTKVSTIIGTEEYSKYSFRSPYLATRGISEKVQRAFKIGFDKKGKAISIPWFDIDGNIINVKFRSVKSKIFYYYPDGQPIKNHLYGMHFIFKMKPKRVFIVESEIDALYLWSNGFPAIAIGGSNFSDSQRQLIHRSPIEELVIATDNDRVGKDIKDRLTTAFVGYKTLLELNFPDDAKDVNDLSPDKLKEAANTATPIGIKLF